MRQVGSAHSPWNSARSVATSGAASPASSIEDGLPQQPPAEHRATRSRLGRIVPGKHWRNIAEDSGDSSDSSKKPVYVARRRTQDGGLSNWAEQRRRSDDGGLSANWAEAAAARHRLASMHPDWSDTGDFHELPGMHGVLDHRLPTEADLPFDGDHLQARRMSMPGELQGIGPGPSFSFPPVVSA